MNSDSSSARIGWRVSTACDANGGSCVEAGPLFDGSGRVAVRQSLNPHGPIIFYTREEWEAFVTGVRHGEFDFFPS